MLLSVLMTMGILGGLAAFAFTGANPTIPAGLLSPSTLHGGQTTTTNPQTIIRAAERALCVQDAQAIAGDVTQYALLNSSLPTRETGITIGNPGTYRAGKIANYLLNNGYILSWPTSSQFAISVSTTANGEVAVYVPRTSRRPVLFEHETALTGCNAL
jgi:hypothetical protein